MSEVKKKEEKTKKYEEVTEEGEQRKKRKMEEKKTRREGLLISDDLKEILRKDSEFISSKKHYELPRPITVSKILSDFDKSEKDEVTSYIIKGLISYFNLSVGKLCLYKSERTQFQDEIEKINKIPSEQYGLEHLIRFLTKLPKLLDGNMEISTQEIVKKKVKDLEKFIENL